MAAHWAPARGNLVSSLLLVSLSVCLVSATSVDQAFAQGRAYYWGDAVVNGDSRTFRFDLPATTQQLTLTGMDGGSVIGGVGVSRGGSMIAVGGRDNLSMGIVNVYGPTGGSPIATLHNGDGDDDYQRVTFSPDSAWVAFVADLDLNGANALYVVPSGGGSVKRVSQPPASSANDVTHYTWANDSKTIAYRGDPVTDSNFRLWTVDVSDVVPAPIDVVPGGANPNVQVTLAFDSSDRIYFISNFEVTGTYRFYRADKDGTNLEQVPGTNLNNGGGEASVVTYGISPDGSQVAFGSNSPDVNLYQVYTMPVAGSSPVLVSNAQTIPDASSRGPLAGELIAWSPDASKLAMVADWDPGSGALDNDFSVFVVPSSAPAGGTRIMASPSGSADAVKVEFASNTTAIVRGDLVVNNDNELYATSDLSTADQDPASKLVQDVPASGDVSDFVVLPPAITVTTEPEILAITDVPNDQGKQVSIEWLASGLDTPGSQTPITEYAIFRQIGPILGQFAAVRPTGALLTGWHYLASVPAFTDSGYAVVVPTLRDSTIEEGLYNTTFLVRAATATPSVFFDSAPDSGYSVDNLAPAAPMSLAFAATRVLAWDQPLETDFAYHTVYGSTTQLLQDAVLIGYTVDQTFDVNAMPNVYYLVTTTDHSGNEGPAAALIDPGTVSTEPRGLPGAFALLSARPNPFRSATVIAFELPTERSVDVRVVDAAGRVVRRIMSGRLLPGLHTGLWDGVDDAGQRVAPGVYFIRVQAGAEASSKRVVLLE